MQRAKIQIQNLSYAYRGQEVLHHVSLEVPANAITVFFGPAGGAKTTLLRLMNRLNDLLTGTHMEGHILINGQDIYAPNVNVSDLRRRVGMVFSLPLPLPAPRAPPRSGSATTSSSPSSPRNSTSRAASR